MRPVVGFEGLYSLTEEDKIYSERYSKFMKPCLGTNGYLFVGLFKNDERINGWIHVLMAEAYHTKPSDKHQAHHKNEIKTDNHKDNIEWLTNRENSEYSTAKEVTLVKNNIKIKVFNIRRFCEENNLTRSCIYEILKGRKKPYKGYSLCNHN